MRDLRVHFRKNGVEREVVHGVSYALAPGRVLAVVGESGSGKSVSALALARLLPPPPACRVSGSVLFDGREISTMPDAQLRRLRGREIAYVFQEPGASLNPSFTIGFQIAEALRAHFPGVDDVRGRAARALEEVGIRDAAARLDAWPHELSGGMAQRVMIAMALACQPRLLVADEPTTALDATIQRQILELLAAARQRRGMAVLLITHNFGIVANYADDVVVMRNGEIVERGPVRAVLAAPTHEYTRTLLAAVPRLRTKPAPLSPLQGFVS